MAALCFLGPRPVNIRCTCLSDYAPVDLAPHNPLFRYYEELACRMATPSGSSGPSKEEEVDLTDYDDYTDAVCPLGRFLNDVYMYRRIHPSLGHLTPTEFEIQGYMKLVTPGCIKLTHQSCVQLEVGYYTSSTHSPTADLRSRFRSLFVYRGLEQLVKNRPLRCRDKAGQ